MIGRIKSAVRTAAAAELDVFMCVCWMRDQRRAESYTYAAFAAGRMACM